MRRQVRFAEMLPTGRDESSSEEKEDDLNLQDVEGEPVGPTLADHPYWRVRSKMPQLCTCFSTVLPVRFNLCPECDCRDSMIPKNSILADKVAKSKVVSDQRILSPWLRSAISGLVATRIMRRMKTEWGLKRGRRPRVASTPVGRHPRRAKLHLMRHRRQRIYGATWGVCCRVLCPYGRACRHL